MRVSGPRGPTGDIYERIAQLAQPIIPILIVPTRFVVDQMTVID